MIVLQTNVHETITKQISKNLQHSLYLTKNADLQEHLLFLHRALSSAQISSALQ